MARIEVEGTVASVNGTGSGFTVKETVTSPTRAGFTWDVYWKAWLPRAATTQIPNKGDRVRIAGTWAGRVDKNNPKYIDHVLDDIQIVDRQLAGPPAAPAEEGPPEDAWASTPGVAWEVATVPADQDTPF